MPLNRAELVRRLEALERQVATHPDIPWDVERFVHLSDSVVMRCEGCDEVNIPADVWDVCRRLVDGGYETLYGVMIRDDPEVEKAQAKKVWRAAEDQAYALAQVLDALPSLIQCLRMDAQEGEKVPSVDGVDLVLGPRHVWVDPAADPNQENGVYEVTVHAPPGCEVSAASSRVCERGTQGCVLSHAQEGSRCECECPDGPCAHDWTGPRALLDDGRGDTVTCAHCGMWAINHDMRVLP